MRLAESWVLTENLPRSSSSILLSNAFAKEGGGVIASAPYWPIELMSTLMASESSLWCMGERRIVLRRVVMDLWMRGRVAEESRSQL